MMFKDVEFSTILLMRDGKMFMRVMTCMLRIEIVCKIEKMSVIILRYSSGWSTTGVSSKWLKSENFDLCSSFGRAPD